jgi:hypothetical protein
LAARAPPFFDALSHAGGAAPGAHSREPEPGRRGGGRGNGTARGAPACGSCCVAAGLTGWAAFLSAPRIQSASLSSPASILGAKLGATAAPDVLLETSFEPLASMRTTGPLSEAPLRQFNDGVETREDGSPTQLRGALPPRVLEPRTDFSAMQHKRFGSSAAALFGDVPADSLEAFTRPARVPVRAGVSGRQTPTLAYIPAPRHRTRTALMADRRRLALPPQCYDLDGDGVVDVRGAHLVHAIQGPGVVFECVSVCVSE